MSSTELSIITPVLNGAAYIQVALDSVRGQMTRQVEHIVVDGGSTDGTLELLEKHPNLQVIRCPGSTIYEAINSGIKASVGDYIGILNSDDWYVSGALDAIFEAIAENPAAEVLSAGAALVRGDYEDYSFLRKWDGGYSSDFSLEMMVTGTPIINARFFTKSLFRRIGYFDPLYKLAGDREFLLRAAIEGVNNVNLDCMVYSYRSHQQSKTLSGERLRFLPAFEEHIKIAEEHLERVDLSEKDNSIIRDWHGYSCFAAGWRRILLGDLKLGFNHFVTGFRVNPLWPIALVRHRLICRQ